MNQTIGLWYKIKIYIAQYYYIIHKVMSSIFQTTEKFDKLPLFLEYLNTPSFNEQYGQDELTYIMTKYNSDKGYGLSNIFRYHGALPPNKIVHNYTYFYDRLFSEYRNYHISLFEIGVGIPDSEGSWGASLIGWKEYFKVIGLDSFIED